MANSSDVQKTPSVEAMQRYGKHLDELNAASSEQVQSHSVEVDRQMGLIHDQNEEQQNASSVALNHVSDILSPHARYALDRILGKPKDWDEDYLRKVTKKGA